MPRYHFNIRDEQGLIPDEEGVELPNAGAAREEAEEGAREILADAIRGNKELDGRKIEIVAENGELVGTVKFSDMLRART